jgi:choline-glycine betaine transporter
MSRSAARTVILIAAAAIAAVLGIALIVTGGSQLLQGAGIVLAAPSALILFARTFGLLMVLGEARPAR